MTIEIGDNLFSALCILMAPAMLAFIIWRTNK